MAYGDEADGTLFLYEVPANLKNPQDKEFDAIEEFWEREINKCNDVIERRELQLIEWQEEQKLEEGPGAPKMTPQQKKDRDAQRLLQARKQGLASGEVSPEQRGGSRKRLSRGSTAAAAAGELLMAAAGGGVGGGGGFRLTGTMSFEPDFSGPVGVDLTLFGGVGGGALAGCLLGVTSR